MNHAVSFVNEHPDIIRHDVAVNHGITISENAISRGLCIVIRDRISSYYSVA